MSNMVKTGYVLLVSAIIMLAASVVVAVVAVIFHPSNSEAARQVRELKPKIEKLRCYAGKEKDPDVCKKYESSKKQVSGGRPNCTLTEARKQKIVGIVEEVLRNDRTVDENLKTLKAAELYDRKAEVKIAEKIRKLSLYVPKPSAHWYLDGQPDYVEGSGNMQRNISKWVYENGREVAHTLHGIKHQDGKMHIPVEGWYNIYVQIDFQTKILQESKMTFEVKVMKTSGKDEETLGIIHDKRVVTCHVNAHQKFHTCAVLNKSGVYKLVKGDLLVVQVEMLNEPGQVQVTQHSSRSYFGVNFVTGYPYVK